jgi:hypothetical protein
MPVIPELGSLLGSVLPKSTEEDLWSGGRSDTPDTSSFSSFERGSTTGIGARGITFIRDLNLQHQTLAPLPIDETVGLHVLNRARDW